MDNLLELSKQLISLNEHFDLNPESISTYQKAGWHLLDEKYYHEATLVFRGLIELEPHDLDMYRGYILAACHSVDLLPLREMLETVFSLLEGKEEHFGLYLELLALYAGVLYTLNEKHEAVHIAEYVVEQTKLLEEDIPWAKSFKKDLKKAQKVLATISYKKNSVDDENLLDGLLLESWKQVDTDNAAWADVLNFKEEELIEMFDAGSVFFEAGDFEKALQIFEGLVALDNSVPLFVFACAQAHKELGDPQVAQKMYTKAVRMARELTDADAFRADALYQRALLFLKQKDYKQALKSLKEILRLNKKEVSKDVRHQAKRLYLSLKDAL